MMIWLIVLVVLTAGAIAIRRWSSRRIHDVDDFYERNTQDPPPTDLGSYLGGDR